MEVRCRITHSSMNDLLLSGALEYLESCPGVCIEANSNPPIVPTMIGHWESQYKQKLPQDLKDFLSVSDGFNINWSVSSSFGSKPKLKGWRRGQPADSLKIGCISINSLQDIIPITNSGHAHAFQIQDITPFGKVCIVYSESDLDKTIGSSIKLFLNEEWTFLTEDFTSYFRLQIQYLGIRGWQMSRTKDGMPQDSSDWLNFYVPSILNQSQLVFPPINTVKSISMDKIQKLITIMNSREENN